MRKYQHILLSASVLFLLFVCLIGAVFSWDLYELQENRKLAEVPAFKELPLDEWPMAFEDYFDDHFGFRNTFIRRYNKLMRKIEKNKQVEFGKEGWLFLNFHTVMRDYMGRMQPDIDKMERVTTRVDSRIKWLEQKNIPYLFVIIPNKVSVYSEYLSDPLPKLKGKNTRECLLEYFDGRFDNNLHDLTPVLLEAKKDQMIYMSTDTHWNNQGAFIGYSSIMDRVLPLLPGLPEKINYDDLEKKTAAMTGDLAIISGTPDKFPLTGTATYNTEQTNWTTNELTNAVFLTEAHMPLLNKPPYTIHNPDGKYNAVVFHDSFTMSLVQLLPHHFKNTTFIWRYSTSELLQSVVEICQPDIIIEEVLERFLVEEAEKGGAFVDEVIPMQEQE